MQTFILDFIDSNMGMIAGILATHFGASILTVFTKTRNSKWYRLIEILALVIKKAKDK